MSFHVKVAAGVALLVGVALAAIFLLGSGDEKAIEQLLVEGAAAHSRGDAEAVIALISKSYRTKEDDYEAICKRLRDVRGTREYPPVEVVGSAIEVSGKEADAHVRVRGRMGPYRGAETGLRLKLRREEGGWKVTAAEEIR